MEKYASVVKEQQRQQVQARMHVLQQLHIKTRRQLQALISENKTTNNYVFYRVPLMHMDAPIIDLKYAMNYVMSGLAHDGFQVCHVHSNVICIQWEPTPVFEAAPFPVRSFI